MMNTSGGENQRAPPPLCANSCGFYGSVHTRNLCSKCYRNVLSMEQEQQQLKQAAVNGCGGGGGDLKPSRPQDAVSLGLPIKADANVDMDEELEGGGTTNIPPSGSGLSSSLGSLYLATPLLQPTATSAAVGGHVDSSNCCRESFSSAVPADHPTGSSGLVSVDNKSAASGPDSSAMYGPASVTAPDPLDYATSAGIRASVYPKSPRQQMASLSIVDQQHSSFMGQQETLTAAFEVEEKSLGDEPSAVTDARPVQVNTSRCFKCNKKIGLLGFQCRCSYFFCGTHRHADGHDCPFDYKAYGRQQLSKANQRVVADKINNRI